MYPVPRAGYAVPVELRDLPSIDRLLRSVPELPRELALLQARALVAEVRAGAEPPEDWVEALRARVAAAARPHLRRVINATGIVLHTNLGRAPLGRRAVRAVTDIAEGYSNLELDLATGERGERLSGVAPLLRALTGAEDAVVVNNCAAAVLLMLTATAQGREVVVSRGELVEIGGAFRIPEVITACGARLREVGATNRTRAKDLAAGVNVDTAAILRVHPSNFKQVGFVEQPSRADTAAVAREAGVLYLEDLGSGALLEGLGEPAVREVVAAGADLVCFSGDKLLGGPQAGIVVGRATLVARLRRHPLYRALRCDRLVLAALEATLRDVQAGVATPVEAMLRASAEQHRVRSESFAARLAAVGIAADVLPDEGFSGGGSAPGEGFPTWVVSPRVASATTVSRRLRAGDTPVIARIRDDRLRLDLRAVLPEEESRLLDAVRAAVASGG